MKIHHIFLALSLLMLLSGCRVPSAAETPTATPTVTVTPNPTATSSRTPLATSTHFPTFTPTQTATPKPTQPTSAASPTATSIYPVSQQTALPDAGFVEITAENAASLSTVFQVVQQNMLTTAISRDGQQLFVATNRGVLVYNRQGEQIAYWANIMLPSQTCETCMSINKDGSRFAVMTHREGKWLIQVYNVFENNASLLLEKPTEVLFQGIPNEVSVALSPDGVMLAYGTADGDGFLLDMNNSNILLTHKGGVTSMMFSPDGVYFVIRQRRQLLFWKTLVWKNPINLLLPADDASYTFSADGKRMAISESDKITAYQLDTLRPNREILVSTPKDLKRKWELAFIDGNILAGYSTRWNGTHTKATVDVAQWNLQTGDTLQLGSHETDFPDGLTALWGVNIPPMPLLPGPVMVGDAYSAFRFINEDQLLVNSTHSACWLKLSSGETTCLNDLRFRILTSNTEAFREVSSEKANLLQSWSGQILAKLLQPYPFLFVNGGADFRFVNVNDGTTDVYGGIKNDLLNSFPGSLINYAEKDNRIVLTLQQKPSGMIITMFEQPNSPPSYQKNIDFILKPLLLGDNHQVYLLQQDVGQPGVVLKMITDGGGISDLALLPFFIAPDVMTRSNSGVFAMGMKDGNVAIVSPNGLQVTNFQASYTPITGIALTPNGRYLAVGSTDGVRIFAVFP